MNPQKTPRIVAFAMSTTALEEGIIASVKDLLNTQRLVFDNQVHFHQSIQEYQLTRVLLV